MMCWYPFDEGIFGTISTSRQSSGPIVNSVLLNILGSICVVSILSLAMQFGQLITQALSFRASPGKYYLALHSCIIFVVPRCLFVFPCRVDRSPGIMCFGIII